jgi:hypothetical protein
MTTFTTEDRIIAEKNGSVTINVEPIPFAGLITITENKPVFKDLTDAEIADICNKVLAPKGGSIFTFARAILRKAQEK